MILYLLLIAFLLGLIFTKASILLAPKIGCVDIPNQRKVHTKHTPRIGGVGFVLAWLISTLGLLYFDIISLSFKETLWFFGALSIFILGISDDKWNLSPKIKFLFQFAVAGVLVGFGFNFSSLILEYIPGTPFFLLQALSFFWIVGVINAINLIDGLDGLSSGLSIIALSAYSIIAIILGHSHDVTFTLPLIGALLGFLFFNKHPSKTFMGDCGSLFLGYQLATLPLMFDVTYNESNAYLSLIVPVIILGLPIFDTLFAMVRRVLIGQKPFNPDREHLHHRFMRKGRSHSHTVRLMWIYGFFLSALAVTLVFSQGRQQIGIICLVFFLQYKAVRSLGYASDILRFRHTINYRLTRKQYKKSGERTLPIYSRLYKYILNQKWIQVSLDILSLAFIWYLTLNILQLPITQSNFLAFGIHFILIIGFFVYLKCYQDLSRYLEFATAGKYIKSTLLAGILLYVMMPLLPNGDIIGFRICLLVTFGYLILVLSTRLIHNFYYRFVKREMHRVKNGPQILIFGAGDVGATLFHTLVEMDNLKWRIRGFVDDDPLKKGLGISNKLVLGGILDIREIHQKIKFDILLMSTENLPQDRLKMIRDLSIELGFKVQKLDLKTSDFFTPEAKSYFDFSQSHRDFYL